MKLLTILTLCLALATANAEPPKPKPAGLAPAMFVLAAGFVAGWFIIKLIYSGPPQTTPVNIILLQSPDHVNWSTNAVCYNVVLGSSGPFDILQKNKIYCTDDTMFYRVQVVPAQ